MPVVRFSVSSQSLQHIDVDALFERITSLMVNVLGKKGAVTLVHLAPSDVRLWSVAGVGCSVAASPAYLEAFVTEGTNTPQEKAEFVRQAYALLRDAMPSLASPCYVLVSEMPADAWGYDGQTQASRKVATTEPVSV